MSKALSLPRDPNVSLPAELVVASEENPVVGEPDALRPVGQEAARQVAEEDVLDVSAADEVRGDQTLVILLTEHRA